MDSPKKASARHFEFQMQREKALTRDLEDRNKALQAQLAQLEQDKAELRREKLQLAEEAKRVGKLEERVHALQRECELRDTQLSVERQATTRARAETEQVRSNAKSSIAAWCTAETQWLHEQKQLADAVTALKAELQASQEDATKARAELATTEAALDAKQQEVASAHAACAAAEKALQEQHSAAERCKAQLYDVQNKLYELQRADDKLREAVAMKETEVQLANAKLAQQVAWTEKAEQTIVTLNERLGAAKTQLIESRNEADRLRCDLASAEKTIQQTDAQLQATRKEEAQGAQCRAVLERAVDEMRERAAIVQETLRERQLALRDAELATSAAQSEAKMLEERVAELTMHVTLLEKQLQEARDAAGKHEQSASALAQTRTEVEQALEKAARLADARGEELVVMKARHEEEVAAARADSVRLEEQLAARTQFISDLTAQLAELTDKSARYYGRLQDSERTIDQQRQSVATMRETLAKSQMECFVAEVLCERGQRCADEVLEMYAGVCAYMRDRLRCWCETHTADKAALEAMTEQLARVQENYGEHVAQVTVLQKRLDSTVCELTAVSGKLLLTEQRCGMLTERLQACEERVECADAEKRAALEDAHRRYIELREALMAEQRQIKEEARQEHCRSAQNIATFRDHLTLYFLDASELQRKCSEARAVLYAEAASCVVRYMQSSVEAWQRTNSTLEARCRDLAAYISAAKAMLSRMESEAVSEAEAHRAALASASAALRDLEREKQAIDEERGRLRADIDVERGNALTRQTCLQAQLDEAQSRRTDAEQLCERLRRGLEYEIRRKCEYKAALAALKKMYNQSKEYRRIEKTSAVQAIDEASAEAARWRRAARKLDGCEGRAGDRRAVSCEVTKDQGANSTASQCANCDERTSASVARCVSATDTCDGAAHKRVRCEGLADRGDNARSEK